MRLVTLLAAATLLLQGQTPSPAPVPMDFWRTLEDGKKAGDMLPRYLRAMAEKQFEKRAVRVRETTDWAAWRQQFRKDMMDSLGGPFPDVLFCPTGGITPESAPQFLALPNVKVCGGSWLTPQDAVDAGDWTRITKLALEASALRG